MSETTTKPFFLGFISLDTRINYHAISYEGNYLKITSIYFDLKMNFENRIFPSQFARIALISEEKGKTLQVFWKSFFSMFHWKIYPECTRAAYSHQWTCYFARFALFFLL